MSQDITTGDLVLVVEHEKPLMMALKEKLIHEGFMVETAANGKQGIDRISERTYDLVLLDILMPQMDGLEVLKEMKRMHVDTPVFVVTNLGGEEDRDHILSLGAADCITKSNISLSELVEKINAELK